MPRYLHIPHTPDTARTLTLSGRNCLVVSGIVTPLKSATGAGKGAEAKCVHKARRSPTAGLLRALSRICASHIALPVKPTDDVDVEKEYQLIPIDSL